MAGLWPSALCSRSSRPATSGPVLAPFQKDSSSGDYEMFLWWGSSHLCLLNSLVLPRKHGVPWTHNPSTQSAALAQDQRIFKGLCLRAGRGIGGRGFLLGVPTYLPPLNTSKQKLPSPPSMIPQHVSFSFLLRVAYTCHLSSLTSSPALGFCTKCSTTNNRPADYQRSPNYQTRRPPLSPCGMQLCCRIWICKLPFIHLALCWALGTQRSMHWDSLLLGTLPTVSPSFPPAFAITLTDLPFSTAQWHVSVPQGS